MLAQKFLRCYVGTKNIATTKQSYRIRSLVASDVLLSALNGYHVAVDYGSYLTLAEGQPSTACTHFPFDIVAYRYSTDQLQGIRRTRFDRILNAFSAADEHVYL